MISLRPATERGVKILYELEARTGLQPEQVEDGAPLYYLEADDADVHDFDLLLKSIDPDWRGHLNLNATHLGL